MESMMLKMENSAYGKGEAARIWFSMWFLGAIVTFGAAFFPMFYRLIQARNKHFKHQADFEKQVSTFLKSKGGKPPEISARLVDRNAKTWAASIILIIPVFVILYLLSRDLLVHERREDAFLAKAFPERLFMPQTIPIKTYVLITIGTLGVGAVYWLYKVVNLYNAHFKADLPVEKEAFRIMEEEKAVEHM